MVNWKTVRCKKPNRAFIFMAFFMTTAFLVSTEKSFSQEFIEKTTLLDISFGSGRSQIAKSLSVGGYELADGTQIDFKNWYRSDFPELNLKFLTEINSSVGVIWGFSSGERGEKYRIDPGLWLGFIYRNQLTENSSLTLSGITLLGGDFEERECRADFGAIGGIQSVNCRLAASALPPEKTLDFLVEESGFNETALSIRYQMDF